MPIALYVCGILEEEGASSGGDDDGDNDEDEGDFAELLEDAPNEDDGNERNQPNDKSIDTEVIADTFNGVSGAVCDLLAGFGDLVDVDVGKVLSDVFHVMLAAQIIW